MIDKFNELTMNNKRYSIPTLSDDFDEVLIYNKCFYSVRKGYRWGLVNSDGDLVLPCIYDWIWNILDEKISFRYKGKLSYIPLILLPSKYDFIYGFHEDFSIVKLNNKYGVITEEGQEVFPCIYDNLMYSDDRLFREYIDNNHPLSRCYEGKWIIIDKWGLKINSDRYIQIIILSNGFKKVLDKNGKWGMLDVYNRELIPCNYDKIKCVICNNIVSNQINPFPNKVFFEAILDDNFFIIKLNNEITFSGKDRPKGIHKDSIMDLTINWQVIIMNRYEYEFSSFKSDPTNTQREYSKISIENEIQEVEKDEILTQSQVRKRPTRNYALIHDTQLITTKWGFVNSKGNIIIQLIYDDVRDFYDGLAAVQIEDKWGIINTTGEIVVDCKYDYISDYQGGICFVENRYGTGYLSKDGVVIAWENYSDEKIRYNRYRKHPYGSENDKYTSIYDSEHYNSGLDLDQQDQEFWEDIF